MAKIILIEAQYKDGATQGLKNTEAAVNKLGKSTKNAMTNSASSVRKLAVGLDNVGSKLRYLSLVTGIIEAGTIGLMSSFVSSYRQMEDATLKLNATSIKTGSDLSKVNKTAQDLASTGYMTLAEAATAVSNTLMTGIGIDTTDKLLNRLS